MEKRTNWQRITKFLSPIKMRKWAYFRLLITAILLGLNGVLSVLFLERIIFFLESGNRQAFDSTLMLFLIVLILLEIAHFGTKRWGWMETEMLGHYDLENIYLNKYIQLDNNEVERIGTGKLISIITSGKMTWLVSLSHMVLFGTSFIISILLSFYMMAKLNIFYSLIFVFLLVILFIYALLINKKLGSFRARRYEVRNNRMKAIVKILMSKNEILNSNRIDKELGYLKEVAIQEKVLNQDMGTYRKLLRSTPTFVMGLVICGFFYIGGNMILDGSLKLSQLVGVTGAIILMQRTMTTAVNFFVDLSKDFMNIEKMWDFFEETPSLEGYDTGKDFEYNGGDIRLKNINFAYEEGQNVFSDFSLDLKGGGIYALVGNSGSGKSTLAKLVSGYLRHDSGTIEIDGQDITEVSLKSYYSHIGYLTQEPSVFDGTIIENLTYALKQDISQEKVDEIIKLAKCEFINDFKDGVHTEIGEKGIRLSGGQRQRIAIAKIMLKDPKIIILDEPTSALDSFSEEQISIAMNNLFKGRTVIIIAHRLQTVKHADTIFVFENGEILEEGNHKQLIVKRGVYNKMLELQSGF